MAAHTGQYITWDQALKSDFQFVKDTYEELKVK